VIAPDTTQAERTRLAWRRTSLAALAVTAIAATRLVVPSGASFVVVPVMVGLWLVLARVAHVRMRSLRAGPSTLSQAPVVIGLVVTAYAAVGLLLLIT
jgi:uncharacterized membrane protein YidH (DUF202 family)